MAQQSLLRFAIPERSRPSSEKRTLYIIPDYFGGFSLPRCKSSRTEFRRVSIVNRGNRVFRTRTRPRFSTLRRCHDEFQFTRQSSHSESLVLRGERDVRARIRACTRTYVTSCVSVRSFEVPLRSCSFDRIRHRSRQSRPYQRQQ